MGQMGTLHIPLDRETDAYRVSSAPYASGGRAPGVTEIHGRDKLKKTLLELGIHEDIIGYRTSFSGRGEVILRTSARMASGRPTEELAAPVNASPVAWCRFLKAGTCQQG